MNYGLNNTKKGLVLIAVLWVVVVLGLIVAIVDRTSRLDAKVCDTRSEQLRCKWACRAGLETAAAVLNEDSQRSDNLKDLWSDNAEDFSDIELEGCLLTVQVIDEASKLNINTATKVQLMELPEMTEGVANAILDWRDKNDSPREGGAEGGYYESLPYRYKIRNGPFKTIRELLLVKDVAKELLYGEDTNLNAQLDFNERDGDDSPPADNGDEKLDHGWIAYLTCYSADKNKDADGEKRVNINKAGENKLEQSLSISKAQAKWIVDNRKKGFKSIADLVSNKSPKKAENNSSAQPDQAQAPDLETFSKIADKITVDDEDRIPGRVNVNTAPKIVLTAILGGGDTAEAIADDIIAYRQSLLFGMESIADLLKVESVKLGTFKRIANQVTTRSDIYTVRCFATAVRGTLPGTVLYSEAVIDRGKTPGKRLYSYQGANN